MDETFIEEIKPTHSEKTLFKEFSSDELLENQINKDNAEVIFRPAFVHFQPHLQQFGLSIIDNLVYGFIQNILQNFPNHRFWFSNQKIALIFGISEKTASLSIKSLVDKGFIKASYKMRSNGGQIRFISDITKSNVATLQKVKFDITKSNGNNNNINSNNINSTSPLKEHTKYTFKTLDKFVENKQTIVDKITKLNYTQVEEYFDKVVSYCQTSRKARDYVDLEKVVIAWLNKDNKKVDAAKKDSSLIIKSRL